MLRFKVFRPKQLIQSKLPSSRAFFKTAFGSI